MCDKVGKKKIFFFPLGEEFPPLYRQNYEKSFSKVILFEEKNENIEFTHAAKIQAST